MNFAHKVQFAAPAGPPPIIQRQWGVSMKQPRPADYVEIKATPFDFPPTTTTQFAAALWNELVMRRRLGWITPGEQSILEQHKNLFPEMWQPVGGDEGLMAQIKEDIVEPVQKFIQKATAPVQELISEITAPIGKAVGEILEHNPWIQKALTPPKWLRRALMPPPALRDILLGQVGDLLITAIKLLPIPGARVVSTALNVLQEVSKAGVEYEEAKRAAREAAAAAAAAELQAQQLSGLGQFKKQETADAVRQGLIAVETALEAADIAAETGATVADAAQQIAPDVEARAKEPAGAPPWIWLALGAWILASGGLLGRMR